jgi:hypothetical protein
MSRKARPVATIADDLLLVLARAGVREGRPRRRPTSSPGHGAPITTRLPPGARSGPRRSRRRPHGWRADGRLARPGAGARLPVADRRGADRARCRDAGAWAAAVAAQSAARTSPVRTQAGGVGTSSSSLAAPRGKGSLTGGRRGGVIGLRETRQHISGGPTLRRPARRNLTRQAEHGRSASKSSTEQAPGGARRGAGWRGYAGNITGLRAIKCCLIHPSSSAGVTNSGPCRAAPRAGSDIFCEHRRCEC